MPQTPATATLQQIEIANTVAHEDRYPRHDLKFPNGVRGMPDIVYANRVGYRSLTLDLYLPPTSMEKPATGWPLVVQIHGGGWMGSDKRHSGAFIDFPGVLAMLAGKGYIVASIDYRLSSEARFPAQSQDVNTAIRWLRANAATYGIDPARVVTWGESSGAHLAALAAVSCNAERLEPTAEDATVSASACVAGAVAWFGVFDMSTIARQARREHTLSRDDRDAPEWQLLGCVGNDCPPRHLADASPIGYVDRSDPPMLLIVGDEDTVVPHQQTLEMAEALEDAGVPHQLIVLPGVDHGFIARTSGLTRDANLRALNATFQFIERTVGSKSMNLDWSSPQSTTTSTWRTPPSSKGIDQDTGTLAPRNDRESTRPVEEW